ncbi:hypothetical protein Aglo03_21790 [Actinokineospora globicatena]|uniref:Uncharacterized protein n=1 Tax=Actinokineospora globicatena TaxID=103729 RepID=A0A9W6QN07_9PSEU|nr:hypothetical protein Aglo03_21790 [Actinokineospora globicatena]
MVHSGRLGGRERKSGIKSELAAGGGQLGPPLYRVRFAPARGPSPAQPPPSPGGGPGPVYKDPPTVDLEPTPVEIHMWITSVTQKTELLRGEA